MNNELLKAIKEVADNRSVEICAGVKDIVISTSVNETSSMMKRGAVILGVKETPEDSEKPFTILLGWPSERGEVPDDFDNLT